MTTIQLTDDQAEALREKAQRQGLTLEEWFAHLAQEPPRRRRMTPAEAVEGILELQKFVKPDPDGETVLDYIARGRRF